MRILEYHIEEYLLWILNCQTGNIPKLTTMLVNGYDINTKDDDGNNGLYHSIDNDEIETSFFLIEKGIICSQNDLNKACDKEFRDLVKTIIKQVASDKAKMINESYYSMSLLCTYDFMKWFIKNFSPDVNYCEGHDLTPLSNVATLGDIAKFNLLISEGANINNTGSNNLNTLEWCNEVKENPGVNEIIKIINSLPHN